jgi:hypothetical protein
MSVLFRVLELLEARRESSLSEALIMRCSLSYGQQR